MPQRSLNPRVYLNAPESAVEERDMFARRSLKTQDKSEQRRRQRRRRATHGANALLDFWSLGGTPDIHRAASAGSRPCSKSRASSFVGSPKTSSFLARWEIGAQQPSRGMASALQKVSTGEGGLDYGASRIELDACNRTTAWNAKGFLNDVPRGMPVCYSATPTSTLTAPAQRRPPTSDARSPRPMFHFRVEPVT